jgi:hypothetical protein
MEIEPARATFGDKAPPKPRRPRHRQPAPTTRAHHRLRHTMASVINPSCVFDLILPETATIFHHRSYSTRQSHAFVSVAYPPRVLTDYGERVLAGLDETRRHRLPLPAATQRCSSTNTMIPALPVAVLPLKHTTPSARKLKRNPSLPYSSRPSGTVQLYQ